MQGLFQDTIVFFQQREEVVEQQCRFITRALNLPHF